MTPSWARGLLCQVVRPTMATLAVASAAFGQPTADAPAPESSVDQQNQQPPQAERHQHEAQRNPGHQHEREMDHQHEVQQAEPQNEDRMPDHGNQHEGEAQNGHAIHPQPSMEHDHSVQHAEAATGMGAAAHDDTSSEGEHVAPDPPQHAMPAMPYREMAAMMQMDDTERVGRILLDQFEWRHSGKEDAALWELEGWYGGDYNKLWVKSEGERVNGATEDTRVELLWNRVISGWWSAQAGAREDVAAGPSRTWAAVGVQGLAPYWFDVEATLYVADAGRTAARLKTEYDLLLTQRLIVQPEGEINIYGKADPPRQIGSGVSDLNLGIRLRYELRREIAPYVGITWRKLFGGTADQARAVGRDASDVQLALGVRAWW